MAHFQRKVQRKNAHIRGECSAFSDELFVEIVLITGRFSYFIVSLCEDFFSFSYCSSSLIIFSKLLIISRTVC